MQLTDTFILNEDGYALILKLIQRRIQMDILSDRTELEQLQAKQNQISQKSGFFNSLNTMHKDQASSKIYTRLIKKVNWQEKWEIKYINPLSASLQNIDVEGIIKRYKDSVEGRAKLFLVLQEVVHTPIYQVFDNVEAAGEEKDFKKSINELSNLCYLGQQGNRIFDNTEKFFKDIKNVNGNMLKYGIYGLIGVGALTAVLAMPLIAPAIGGLFGLSGAAAASAGLAMLGGGSIAAGGLGMAGGMTVLVGGSGILGVVAGGAVGKLLSQLPHDAIAINVCKTVNFINYLKETNSSTILLSNAQDMFLSFKQNAEREIVKNNVYKTKKESLQLLAILNTGLNYII
jgi:hypothetical protein